MMKWFKCFVLETLVSIGIIIIFSFVLVAITRYCNARGLNKIFKYATCYAAVNGGTSVGDDEVVSVVSGVLEKQRIRRPIDYSL